MIYISAQRAVIIVERCTLHTESFQLVTDAIIGTGETQIAKYFWSAYFPALLASSFVCVYTNMHGVRVQL